MKKMSKRFLAIVLAALMVVTSIPFVSLSAFAAITEPQAVTDARASLADYESAMDGTKVYTRGMLAAYDAYVDLYKKIDACLYGSGAVTTSAVTTAKNTLDSAITYMTGGSSFSSAFSWTGRNVVTNSVVPSFSNGNSLSTLNDRDNFYHNLLWSDPVTGTTSNSSYDASNWVAHQRKVGYSTTFTNGGNNVQDTVNPGDDSGAEVAVYYAPNTVLFYDGITESNMPVMCSLRQDGGNDRLLTTIYPVAGTGNSVVPSDHNNEIYLLGRSGMPNSKGSDYDWRGGRTYGAAWSIKGTVGNTDFVYARTNANVFKMLGCEYNNPNNRTSEPVCNKLRFKDIIYFATGLTLGNVQFNGEGYKNINDLNWIAGVSAATSDKSVPAAYKPTQWILRLSPSESRNGYNYGGTSWNYSNRNPQNGTNIYILNYKGILETMDQNMNKLNLGGNTSYKMGGARGVIQAYENALSFNTVTTFNNASGAVANKVATTGAAIKNIMDGMKADRVADTNVYAALRNAINDANSTYVDNNVDPDGGLRMYKSSAAGDTLSDSSFIFYEEFKSRYQAATAIFDSVVTNGYAISNATAQANVTSTATALTSGLNSLEPFAQRVDTTQLEIALDNVRTVLNNPKYFSNLNNNAVKITQANYETWVTTVWTGGMEYYKTGNKLKDTPANQQIVDNLTANIVSRLNAMRVNYTTSYVPGIEYDGEQFSLRSAQQLVDSLNAGDYSNWSSVESAYNESMLFLNGVDGVIDNYITSTGTNGTSTITFKAGNVQDSVKFLIDRMNMLTEDIVEAVKYLTPAFNRLTDGTFANRGLDSSIGIAHQGRPINFAWSKKTNQVILRNTYAASDYDLGESQFTFHSTAGNETVLDCIDLNDTSTLATGEFNPSNWKGRTDEQAAMKQADYDAFGPYIDSSLPSETTTGATFKFGVIKVKTNGWDSEGTAMNGEVATTEGDDYGIGSGALFTMTNPADAAAATAAAAAAAAEGEDYKKYIAYPAWGGISSGNGETVANAQWILSVPATTPVADNGTATPGMNAISAKTYTISQKPFGVIYSWKFTDAASNITSLIGWTVAYHPGWSHLKANYSQSTTVVDVTELIGLINQVSSLEQGNYEDVSWAAFTAARDAAKQSEFKGTDNQLYHYSEVVIEANSSSKLTVSNFTNECKTRYQNLYNAYKALKVRASNTELKAAIDAAEPIITAAVQNNNAYFVSGNDNTQFESSTWAAFQNAYNTALNQYNNNYNNALIRALAAEDVQSTIDGFTNALTNAQAALRVYADFAPIDTAVNTLLATIVDDTYTRSAVEAVNTTFSNAANYPYYNVATNNRKNYTYLFSDTTKQINKDIIAEANVISAYTLETATDAGTLAKVIEKFRAQYKDPDAYDGIEDVVAAINNINLYTNVNVLGKKTVRAINYEDQATLDAYAAQYIPYIDAETSPLPKKTYDITIKDMQGNTLKVLEDQPYGENIKIYSGTDETDSKLVDWYYVDYTSNTANHDSTYQGRYFGSAYWINYIVKGDATFKIKQGTAESLRVTYKTNIFEKVYNTDYVAPNGSVTISSANVPTIAFYRFDHFEYEDQNGQTQIINANTSSAINNINKDIVVTAVYTPAEGAETYFYYNALTDRYEEDYYYDSLVIDTSAEAQEAGFASEDFYAWVYTDDYDIFDYDEVPEDSKLKVLHYGKDYAFRIFKDMYVYPLTADELVDCTVDGLVKDTWCEDINNPEAQPIVYTEDTMRDFGTKITTINSFAIPEGAEFSEAGILYYLSQKGATCPVEMTLLAAKDTSTKVKRQKSSSRTEGDQFTISFATSSFSGKTVTVTYRAYVNVKINGKDETFYSEPQVYEQTFV